MSQEQDETRIEKMERLLAANKVKLARDKLIQLYQHEFGYALQADHFLAIDLSNCLVREIYQRVRTGPARRLSTTRDVRSELAYLKKAWNTFSDQYVIFSYRNRIPIVQRGDYIATGVIKLMFKDVWNILEYMSEDELTEDILVAEEGLAFGFAVEVEEYGYTLTSWGLE